MLATILIVFGTISIILSTLVVYSCCVIGATSQEPINENHRNQKIKSNNYIAAKKSDISRPATQQLGGFVTS